MHPNNCVLLDERIKVHDNHRFLIVETLFINKKSLYDALPEFWNHILVEHHN